MMIGNDFEFTTNIFFRCPKCGASDTACVEVAEFSTRGATQSVSVGPIVIECVNCDSQFDGTASCTAGGCEIVLDEFQKAIFYGDSPAYIGFNPDYWIEYKLPENPYQIFLETHGQLLYLLDQKIVRPDDPQLLSRMLFSQLISATEAYLSDTLIFEVISDDKNIRRLIQADKNLAQDKLSLIEIMRDDDVIGVHLTKYLRSILYHNLERVRFLYKSALCIDIIPNDSDWKVLLIAINHRHDCVHRNGTTSDGKPNRIFTKTYIRRVAQAVSNLGRHVEKEIAFREFDPPL